jgi:hypothetical protein
MRPTWCSFVVALLLPLLAAAGQETRGNINGIVQDSGGVIPGAAVKITNTATSQTQQLVTNSSGYFEAGLLNPGTYEVRVELEGYKTLPQSGISLAVGQTVNLTLKLDVGQVSEEVTVVAQSALLDATTVSSGHNFDRQMVEGLPMFSNMPIMLSRFTPGVAPAEAEVQNIFQGYMEGTTSAAGGQIGTGSGFDSRNTATTTPSTAPPTTASAAASPARRTPIRLTFAKAQRCQRPSPSLAPAASTVEASSLSKPSGVCRSGLRAFLTFPSIDPVSSVSA